MYKQVTRRKVAQVPNEAHAFSKDGATTPDLGVGPEVDRGIFAAGERSDPEDNDSQRTCVISGTKVERQEMIRFVMSPDRILTPDLVEKLPGHGAWIFPSQGLFEGRSWIRAFRRAFKRDVVVPEGMLEWLDHLLVKRLVESVGRARRAGLVVSGATQVTTQLRDIMENQGASDSLGGESRYLGSRPEDSLKGALAAEGRDHKPLKRIEKGAAQGISKKRTYGIILTASDASPDSARRLDNLARRAGVEVSYLLSAVDLGQAFGLPERVFVFVRSAMGATKKRRPNQGIGASLQRDLLRLARLRGKDKIAIN